MAPETEVGAVEIHGYPNQGEPCQFFIYSSTASLIISFRFGDAVSWGHSMVWNLTYRTFGIGQGLFTDGKFERNAARFDYAYDCTCLPTNERQQLLGV